MAYSGMDMFRFSCSSNQECIQGELADIEPSGEPHRSLPILISKSLPHDGGLSNIIQEHLQNIRKHDPYLLYVMSGHVYCGACMAVFILAAQLQITINSMLFPAAIRPKILLPILLNIYRLRPAYLYTLGFNQNTISYNAHEEDKESYEELESTYQLASRTAFLTYLAQNFFGSDFPEEKKLLLIRAALDQLLAEPVTPTNVRSISQAINTIIRRLQPKLATMPVQQSADTLSMLSLPVTPPRYTTAAMSTPTRASQHYSSLLPQLASPYTTPASSPMRTLVQHSLWSGQLKQELLQIAHAADLAPRPASIPTKFSYVDLLEQILKEIPEQPFFDAKKIISIKEKIIKSLGKAMQTHIFLFNFLLSITNFLNAYTPPPEDISAKEWAKFLVDTIIKFSKSCEAKAAYRQIGYLVTVYSSTIQTIFATANDDFLTITQRLSNFVAWFKEKLVVGLPNNEQTQLFIANLFSFIESLFKRMYRTQKNLVNTQILGLDRDNPLASLRSPLRTPSAIQSLPSTPVKQIQVEARQPASVGRVARLRDFRVLSLTAENLVFLLTLLNTSLLKNDMGFINCDIAFPHLTDTSINQTNFTYYLLFSPYFPFYNFRASSASAYGLSSKTKRGLTFADSEAKPNPTNPFIGSLLASATNVKQALIEDVLTTLAEQLPSSTSKQRQQIAWILLHPAANPCIVSFYFIRKLLAHCGIYILELDERAAEHYLKIAKSSQPDTFTFFLFIPISQVYFSDYIRAHILEQTQDYAFFIKIAFKINLLTKSIQATLYDLEFTADDPNGIFAQIKRFISEQYPSEVLYAASLAELTLLQDRQIAVFEPIKIVKVPAAVILQLYYNPPGLLRFALHRYQTSDLKERLDHDIDTQFLQNYPILLGFTPTLETYLSFRQMLRTVCSSSHAKNLSAPELKKLESLLKLHIIPGYLNPLYQLAQLISLKLKELGIAVIYQGAIDGKYFYLKPGFSPGEFLLEGILVFHKLLTTDGQSFPLENYGELHLTLRLTDDEEQWIVDSRFVFNHLNRTADFEEKLERIVYQLCKDNTLLRNELFLCPREFHKQSNLRYVPGDEKVAPTSEAIVHPKHLNHFKINFNEIVLDLAVLNHGLSSVLKEFPNYYNFFNLDSHDVLDSDPQLSQVTPNDNIKIGNILLFPNRNPCLMAYQFIKELLRRKKIFILATTTYRGGTYYRVSIGTQPNRINLSLELAVTELYLFHGNQLIKHDRHPARGIKTAPLLIYLSCHIDLTTGIVDFSQSSINSESPVVQNSLAGINFITNELNLVTEIKDGFANPEVAYTNPLYLFNPPIKKLIPMACFADYQTSGLLESSLHAGRSDRDFQAQANNDACRSIYFENNNPINQEISSWNTFSDLVTSLTNTGLKELFPDYFDMAMELLRLHVAQGYLNPAQRFATMLVLYFSETADISLLKIKSDATNLRNVVFKVDYLKRCFYLEHSYQFTHLTSLKNQPVIELIVRLNLVSDEREWIDNPILIIHPFPEQPDFANFETIRQEVYNALHTISNPAYLATKQKDRFITQETMVT